MEEFINIVTKLLTFIILVSIITIIFAWPVQWLWNNSLVGAIDGINKISFNQALGINILFSLLLGSKNSNSKKSE
jgi:hypothetical protein